jgi:hypothetical protein
MESTDMATAPTKKTIILDVVDDQKEFTIRLNPLWEQNSEFYAHKLNQESEALMEAYVLDSYPKSKSGKYFSPDEGAFAVYKACLRLFGQAPIALGSGGGYPESRAVQMQRFEYVGADGENIYEMDLDNPHIWSTTRLVQYIKKNVPDYDLPDIIIGDEKHEEFYHVVKETLTVVGTRTETMQIGWKLLQYPGNDNIQLFALAEDGEGYGHQGEIFRLLCKAKKRDRNLVDEFFQAVIHELENANLFMGRCFEMGVNGTSYLDPFGGMNPLNLVYSDRVQWMLDRQVFSVLREHKKARRRNRALLGTKVLLSGGAGVGKSEAMKWIAQVAIQNGWTAAFLKPGATDAVRDSFYEKISPLGKTVVLREDVETDEPDVENSTVKQRLEARSRQLAISDGISSKGQDIFQVSSTNHEDMLASPALRPGRTDVYIKIESPDCNAFIKLTTMQVGELLPLDVDLRALWGPEEPIEERAQFVKKLRDLDASFLSNGLIESVQRAALKYEDGERVVQEDMYWVLDGVTEHHALYKRSEEAEKAKTKDTLGEAFLENTRRALSMSPELQELVSK